MSTSRLHRTVVAGTLAATLLATGGCGLTDKLENQVTSAVKDKDPGKPSVDTPSPKALLKKSDQALRDATSVRIVASSSLGGNQVGIDVGGDAANTYSEGTLTFEAGKVRFRVVDGRAWVSGRGDVVGRFSGGVVPGGKWAPAARGEATDLLRNLTAGTLLSSMLSGDNRPKPGAKITTIVQDGVPAFRLMVVEKKDTRPYPVVVAADGTWRLLKIGEPTMEAYAEFSDYDAVDEVGVPRRSQLAR